MLSLLSASSIKGELLETEKALGTSSAIDLAKQMVGTHLSLGQLGQELSIVRALLNIVRSLLLINLCHKYLFSFK
jgi:hypothetical protein